MLNMDRVRLTEEWARKERDWDFLKIISAVVSTIFLFYREKHSEGLQRVMEEFVETFPNYISHKRHVADTNIVIFTISLNDLIEKILICLASIDEFVTWNSRVETYENVTDFNNFTENVYCRLRSFLIEDWFFETKEVGTSFGILASSDDYFLI